MDINFNKNEDHNNFVSDLEKIGQSQIGRWSKTGEKQHQQGKLTARERIDFLLDPNAPSIEIGAFAGEGMYQDHGGAPSGGVVVKIGRFGQTMHCGGECHRKSRCMVSHYRQEKPPCTEIAMETDFRLSILVDSAGVYLPMQDEIFPDKEHFGRIFETMPLCPHGHYPNCCCDGSCVAGGAYLPIMSDEALIVDKTGYFWPEVIWSKRTIGETIDNETLGGALLRIVKSAGLLITNRKMIKTH